MSNLRIVGVIPVRLNSKRLPGKALLKIGNTTIIQRCIECCYGSTFLQNLIVTFPSEDHESLIGNPSSKEDGAFNVNIGMTVSPIDIECSNGTERVYHAVGHYNLEDDDIVVNIQGDNYNFDPAIIDECIYYLLHAKFVDVCTPVSPYYDNAVSFVSDRDIVKARVTKKLTKDIDHFVRRPNLIASSFLREDTLLGEFTNLKKHYGIYAYRWRSLKRYMELKPTGREKKLSLEQLRYIDNGIDVGAVWTERYCYSINTEKDYKDAVKLFEYGGMK